MPTGTEPATCQLIESKRVVGISASRMTSTCSYLHWGEHRPRIVVSARELLLNLHRTMAFAAIGLPGAAQIPPPNWLQDNRPPVDNLVSPWVWLSSQRAPPHRRFSRQQANASALRHSWGKVCKSAGDVRDAHVSSQRGELCVCIAAPRASWPLMRPTLRGTSNRIGHVERTAMGTRC